MLAHARVVRPLVVDASVRTRVAVAACWPLPRRAIALVAPEETESARPARLKRPTHEAAMGYGTRR